MEEDKSGPGASIGAPVVALLALAAAACGPGAEEREARLAAVEQEAFAPVRMAVDSADAILGRQVGLTAETRGQLRRHLNARQVATARALGVEPVEDSTEVRRLADEGRLVRLEDSTEHWVVRELTHSVPYVTPDTRAMLEDLGDRFHARLDSLGLPRFRFEITSVLRTGAMQAELRQGNPNASRTTSSHEFGTTVDITYHTFAPPAEPKVLRRVQFPDTLGLSTGEREELQTRIETSVRAALGELASERAAALKGVLGEVLREMQEEERVQPLIERAQPVYHMTVATRYGEEGDGGDIAE